MQRQVVILTDWREIWNDGERELHPAVAVDYRIHDFRDLTGQPGLPKVTDKFMLQVLVDAEVLERIRADQRYVILSEGE